MSFYDSVTKDQHALFYRVLYHDGTLGLTLPIDPSENLKLVWGLSSQFDFVQSPLFLGTDEKVTHEQYRVFANIEYHINSSNTVNLGALVEKNNFSDTELSPRLSFTHAFNHHHYYLSMAR